MHSKTLPTLNNVKIKCAVHYIVHLLCTVQYIVHLLCTVQYIVHLLCIFSLIRMKVRACDFLAWVRGQRKMSQVLGAFVLLYFTMLRPVLAWRAFWNIWTIYFFNFPFFRAAGNRGWLKPQILIQWIRGHDCVYIYNAFGKSLCT
jgi:hypothetical protein